MTFLLLSINFLLYPFLLLGYWVWSIYSPNPITLPRQHRRRSRQTPSNFTILPRNCMVLSNYQLLMWFAYLLGFSNLSSLIFFSWKAFPQEFFVLLVPPYIFLLEKIKEPPKGVFSMIFDTIFVTGHFLYRLLQYIILIFRHSSSLLVPKDLFRSFFSKLLVLLRYCIWFPLYLLSGIIYISIFLYKLILPIYLGYSPSDTPQALHSIFLPGGVTLDR